MSEIYTLHVNGRDREVRDAWLGENLLYVLRERLGLLAAKGACEQGECGSCSVQVGGGSDPGLFTTTITGEMFVMPPAPDPDDAPPAPVPAAGEPAAAPSADTESEAAQAP